MMKLVLLAILSFGISAQAQRFELGVGAGTTHAVQGETFRNTAKTGDGRNYWLGYGFNKNWGAELGYDDFDFDGTNSKHQAINLSGVYRFLAEKTVHPIAKLGVSSVDSKNITGEKTNSIGGKAAAGIEADFRYISVGALFNYHYIQKSDKVADLKDTQAFIPSLFLSIHNAVDTGVKASQPVAPVAVVERKDSDGDGIYDEDDQCPNTPAGVVTNEIGCSEKEKASVRLNIEFATGKADILPQHASEVQKVANFMKRFPQTKVEVAGHTDNRGSVAVNNALSQKRADSVRAALVQEGVEESRLTAKGYGSAHPIADNNTAVGREQNRRVTADITVVTDKKK